jgi:hypothetical protein
VFPLASYEKKLTPLASWGSRGRLMAGKLESPKAGKPESREAGKLGRRSTP